MKRALVALSLALLISVLAVTFIDSVSANPIMPDPETVVIKVQSPIKNMVYNTGEIPLQFYATIGYSNAQPINPWFCGKVLSVQYWLDGKLVGQHAGEDLPKSYSVALTGLSDGEHSIKIWMSVHCFQIFRMGDGNGGYREMYRLDEYLSGSETASFTVDTSLPSIRVLTSQETFEASDVPLNFTVNEPVAWLGYSLDGNNIVTATDQVASTERFGAVNYQLVLNGLPAGEHSLTVYAEDSVGNRGASEPFSFTIAQEASSETKQASTLFPTSTVAVAVITSTALVFFGLAAYFVRARKKRSLT